MFKCHWCYIRCQRILQEAQEEITKIEEEMQLRFEEPVNMIMVDDYMALNAFFDQGGGLDSTVLV